MSEKDKMDKWVIWLSGQRWDQDGGTHGAMATAIADFGRILWVDPPVSPITRSQRRHHIKPTLTQATDRITRLTPVVLPGFSRLGVRATTPALVRAQVRWAMRKLNFEPSAVVMLHLGGLLGGWGDAVMNVMYATDDYVAGAELMRVPVQYLRRQERQALSNADIVVVVSDDLAAHWSGMGAEPVVIANGCWPLGSQDATQSADDTGLQRPVVGLIGRLSDRIDFDVLDAISDAGLSLLLMGPHDPRWEPERFGKLTSKPSVQYIGPVPYEEIPARLAAIDVGITPYADSAFNRASFPLKSLEYLSVGLPVVASGLPAMRWLRADVESSVPTGFADQVLVIAEGIDDYVKAIRSMAINRSDANAKARRIAFAERHSWPQRAKQFASLTGLLPDATR